MVYMSGTLNQGENIVDEISTYPDIRSIISDGVDRFCVYHGLGIWLSFLYCKSTQSAENPDS